MSDGNAWLKVVGDQIVDDTGSPVTLEGFGLGGWMNMENFVTGFPGTESMQREVLRRVLGPEGYKRFFDRFLQAFFDEPDAALIASLGLNSLRVPFNYRHFEDDAAPFELKPEGFRWLDRVVELCAKNGIYTILDMHALPGHQNQHWHSDNPTHQTSFWQHRQFQDRAVWLWEIIADRYKDQPWVAGYNPVNEPADVSGERIVPFYDRIERAIRAIDPRHILFLDGNRYSTQFDMFSDPYPNTVFTAHDYARPGIVPGARYPGVVDGAMVDRHTLEEVFLRRTEFMRRTGTPIWIGEFGPQYTGDSVIDAERLSMLSDQLEIYRDYGASWSLWTYKDIGLQGVAVVPPTSAYVSQIRPALDKKTRLGTDAWGGSDAGVRQVLDPIEQLIAREFPDFDPYPWGPKRWINTLVRHILLAEPLVDDFGRCFEGVDPERAEELAGSFALAQCSVRRPLAELLVGRARHIVPA